MSNEASSRRLFGTDGIRGMVNLSPMTAQVAMALGRALTFLLQSEKKLRRRPKILIGQDTRLSGDMLSSAVAAGIMSQGGDVFLADVLPTPGLANLASSTRADAGIVISASHNPFQDNGLKIFDGQGYKLSDETEARLEELMNSAAFLDENAPKSENVGRAFRFRDAVGRYVVSLKSTFPKAMDLEGLKIVLDCAHGAAFKSAPAVFEELGAEVVVLGDSPDGFNINREAGSLHPEVCAAKVVESKADLGVALDGDADRAIFIDHQGGVVDGDQIMYLCAIHLKKEGKLAKDAIAATVMSNLGLEKALQKAGIGLFRTKVGDRYVAECLRREGLNFGGEQSGHLIFLDHATTGDGTLAALQTLAVMKSSGKTLHELSSLIALFPQTLINVPASSPRRICLSPQVEALVKDVQLKLGEGGRILLRPSGTEPVVRVMIEGEDPSLIRRLAQECADFLAQVKI
ncbi:MAG: phosphoglucosamine mutase [Deltaproteobacteria bacterium]|jgi:phosphoglucosamine mutase|nr:phosphoglucosamine mutase [Deltaproteobacteria bacterium]